MTDLHVSDNHVWLKDESTLPENTGLTVQEFLDVPKYQTLDKARLLGSYNNAPLIAGLYLRKTRKQLPSVSVVTPLCVPATKKNMTPQISLERMHVVQLSPSLGGFHEVDANDYISYALADEIAKRGATDTALTLLKRHPAWLALSFLRFVDIRRCCELVAAIIDPRWYITLSPESTSLLKSHLAPERQDATGRFCAGCR